jgi:hypothetical protein
MFLWLALLMDAKFAPQFIFSACCTTLCQIATIKGANSDLFDKVYFLGDQTALKHVHQRTREQLIHNVCVGAVSFVIIAIAYFVLASPYLYSLLETNAPFWNLLSILNWFILTPLMISSQVVVFSLITARIQDQLDNIKMFYVLIGDILSKKQSNKTVQQKKDFDSILLSCQKMAAACQVFSWDWQLQIVGTLLGPLSVAAIFFLHLLNSIVLFLVAKTQVDVGESFLHMLIGVLGIFIFMFVFINLLWRLSRTKAAANRLLRLLDFTLKVEHVKDVDARMCVAEIRHLIEGRVVTKVCGVNITGELVLEIVGTLLKGALLLFSSIVVAGSVSTTGSGSGGGSGDNVTTRFNI